jgi:hypothetical protein
VQNVANVLNKQNNVHKAAKERKAATPPGHDGKRKPLKSRRPWEASLRYARSNPASPSRPVGGVSCRELALAGPRVCDSLRLVDRPVLDLPHPLIH